MTMLFNSELELPNRGISQRVTVRPDIDPGQSCVLFDETGPGCMMHWWLTYTPDKKNRPLDRAHDLQIRIYYDDQEQPTIDVSLAQFFAVLLEEDIYRIDNAAIKILPLNAMNCYFPIPFKKMRMEITNNFPETTSIWFMGDWQSYPKDVSITPMRFNVLHHREFPARAAATFPMANVEGDGFIAGLAKGVRMKDLSDCWFHTGGDTFLLDGQTSPRAIRGIGGEDLFNMSFGIWECQTEWVGAPLTRKTSQTNALGSGYEGVMYRIFGHDPIWFDTSAIVQFGSKANDLESVVYAYLAPKKAPKILTVSEWMLAGPFYCKSDKDFQKEVWGDKSVSDWPTEYVPNFGQYSKDDGTAVSFKIPLIEETRHGWCDFAGHFRGIGVGNIGTQPAEVAGYAVGKMKIDEQGEYDVHVAFDDMLKLWIDGEEVFSGKCETGFGHRSFQCQLPAGNVEIRVKLSNSDNYQWRLWAFNLRFEKK